MSLIHVSLAGYGYWGPNLLRVLQECEDVRVVACCDPDPLQRRRLTLRYPGVVPVADFDEMLDDSVDAVVIATPIATHAACVANALRRGKHVFVEKPLCTSVEEADSLVDLAARQGLVLAVGHTFLYHPAVLAIRDALHSGQIGDLHYITSSRANLDVYRHDTNVLWDLAVHDLSILQFWLENEPASLQVTARGCGRLEHPDVAFIALRYSSGLIAQVEVSWLAPGKLRRMVVAGDRQMAVFDDTEIREKLRFYSRSVLPQPPRNFGEFQLSSRQGDLLSPWLDPCEPLAAEMVDFLHCVRSGAAPRSDGRLGALVVRTLVRLQQAWEETGAAPLLPTAPPRPLVPIPARFSPRGAKHYGHPAAS